MRDKGQIIGLEGTYREDEVPELPPEDVLQSLPRQDLEHLAKRYRLLAEALAQAEEAEAYAIAMDPAHWPRGPAEPRILGIPGDFLADQPTC